GARPAMGRAGTGAVRAGLRLPDGGGVAAVLRRRGGQGRPAAGAALADADDEGAGGGPARREGQMAAGAGRGVGAGAAAGRGRRPLTATARARQLICSDGRRPCRTSGSVARNQSSPRPPNRSSRTVSSMTVVLSSFGTPLAPVRMLATRVAYES